MRQATFALVSLLLPLGLLACAEGSASPPIAPGPGGPEVPDPRDVAPLPGGGTSGGDLDGVLTVFVLDPEDRPVAGARVLAGDLRAETDAEGRVDFHGSALSGSLDVHVFAEGYAYHSALGLDASVLTAALEPRRPSRRDVALGVGRVSGAVEGWHRLPAPTSGLARVVRVEAFGTRALAEVAQLQRPGSATIDDPDGLPANIAIDGAAPYPSWRDYALRLEVGARGLVAFGSTFDPDRSPALVRQLIGIHTGLDVADGDEISGVDIRLTHPLDRRVHVQGPHMDLSRRTASVGLDLGAGRVAPLGGGPLDRAHRLDVGAPRLVGELADAQYVATVHLSSAERVGDHPARETLGVRRGLRPELNLEDMLAPPSAPSLAGRTLAAPAPSEAELSRVRISDEAGQLRWELWRLDPGAPAHTLPEVPEGFADGLPAGALEIVSSAFDLGPEAPARLSLDATAPRSEAHHRTRVER
jgi:hypothetical protein